MAADLFSEILRITRAQSYVYGGMKAGGDWAIRFPALDKMSFYAIVKGACCLRMDGDTNSIPCGTGDVLLITSRSGFLVGNDLCATPMDAAKLFGNNLSKIVQLGDGEESFIIGGSVRLNEENRDLLRGVLPPVVHVSSSSPHAPVLQWLLDRLVQERSDSRPGVAAASEHLAQLMFLQILRAYMETAESLNAGWLRALADKRISPALQLMHDEPGRDWNLEELAKACAMSRTTFAVHFKMVSGVTPVSYLTAWRMRLAKESLRNEKLGIAELARKLGYTSEHAFSAAFKRVVGCAPKHYQKKTLTFASD